MYASNILLKNISLYLNTFLKPNFHFKFLNVHYLENLFIISYFFLLQMIIVYLTLEFIFTDYVSLIVVLYLNNIIIILVFK